MLLKWSVRASLRGWYRISTALVNLDCWLNNLGTADRRNRRIRRDQARRRKQPPASLSMEWEVR